MPGTMKGTLNKLLLVVTQFYEVAIFTNGETEARRSWVSGPGLIWFVTIINFYHIVVQSLSHAWLFVTPWTAACQASLSFTISQSLLNSYP